MGFPCPMHGLEPWVFGCSDAIAGETVEAAGQPSLCPCSPLMDRSGVEPDVASLFLSSNI